MKNNIWWWAFALLIVVVLMFAWSNRLQSNDPGVVARGGIHWHPKIHIYIDEEEMLLPENIGLSNGHNPIHTHDEDSAEGVVHFEFANSVKADDIKLQSFFDSWGKDINDFGELTKMEVNGVENNELAEYEIKENDIIKLYYQSKQ